MCPPLIAFFSIPLDFTFFSDTSLLDYALCGKNWKKDTRIWCSPRCKDGQNCHCGRLSFHFPDIRSRWRLWRLKADHCALLSKRPIIILAIFRPHQWLIIVSNFHSHRRILFLLFYRESFVMNGFPILSVFAQGFLLPYIWWSVSCYKYSFGQIFEPDLCRSSARQRGWGLLATLVKISATQ